MDDNTLKAIEQLSLLIGSSSNVVISEYTKWFFSAAVSWIFFGIVMIVFAIKFNVPDDWDVTPVLIKAPIIFIGMLYIGANIPDLFSPTGVAINHLINGIRG